MPPLYPAGLAGAGLLLLRLSVASSLVALNLPFPPGGDLRQIFVLFVASALCIGVGVRVLAMLSLISVPGALDGGAASVFFAVLHIAIALALAFTGPGAYSVDARLFGRRRVKLRGIDDTSE